MKTLNAIFLLICLSIFITCSQKTSTIEPSVKLPTKIWDKTLGGNASDEAKIILPISDGGFIIAGNSISNISGDKSEKCRGGSDYWIIKTNSKGEKIWDKTFGGDDDDVLGSVITTSDGGYILAGYSPSLISGDKTETTKVRSYKFGEYDYDYWVVKINSSGEKVWDRTLGGYYYDFANSIVATSDGGFIVAGISNSNISGDKTELNNGRNYIRYDFWLIKINSLGQKVWDKTIGRSEDEDSPVIIATKDSGFIIAGSSKSPTNPNDNDYFIVKINNDGRLLWNKTLIANGNDKLSSIIPVSDGGYVIAGSSNSGISGDKTEDKKGEGFDYWIVKIRRE
jgi:hypothetical protein